MQNIEFLRNWLAERRFIPLVKLAANDPQPVGSVDPNLHTIATDLHNRDRDLAVDANRFTDFSAEYQHDIFLPENGVIEGRNFVPYPEAGLHSWHGTIGVEFCSANYTSSK